MEEKYSKQDNSLFTKFMKGLLITVRFSNTILNVLLITGIVIFFLLILADYFISNNFFSSQIIKTLIELGYTNGILAPAVWISSIKLYELIFIILIVLIIVIAKRQLKKYIYERAKKPSKKIVASFINLFMNFIIGFFIIVLFINIMVVSYVNTEFNKLSPNKFASNGFKIEQLKFHLQITDFESQNELDEIMDKVKNNSNYLTLMSDKEYIAFGKKISSLIDKKGGVKTEEEHYFRNNLNRAPANLTNMIKSIKKCDTSFGWILLPPKSSFFHMYGKNGEYNLKFVSADGLFEAVYNKDGVLLTKNNDPSNMGTFNYGSPTQHIYKHSMYDIVPYFAWGNLKNYPISDKTGEDSYNKNKDAQKYHKKIKKQVSHRCSLH